MSIEIHGIESPRAQGRIDFAYRFAAAAHEGQKRKYTGEPYIVHCISVAQIVASVTTDTDAIGAAFLHDTIEDCGVTFEEIRDAGFGIGTATLVRMLTDVSKPDDGNRAIRKEIDRQHLAKASPLAKTVKLADLIDNSASIITHDRKFAQVYMREKEALLEVLVEGDATLYSRAKAIVDSWNSGR